MQVIQLELLGLSYRNHVSIIHVDECIGLLSPTKNRTCRNLTFQEHQAPVLDFG